MNKKMRMFQALLIVAILLLQMIIPIVPSIAAGETITIECKDKNFYNAIKKELGDKVKTSDDNGLKLTALKSDVEGISELYLYQDYNAEDTIKIKDISGIENFKGLTTLDLSCNQISDISAIAGLTNLKNLNLGRNQISDISKISGLTNLIFLDLNFNKISDISKISGLTKLTTLCLSGNEISDISKISGLTKLTNLRLGGNEISDISAISGLTKLTSLDLGGNEISDTSAIAGLTKLTDLFLYSNKITKTIPKTQKEVELPPIFTQAKDKNSKIYTEKEYEFTNCKLNEDGTKVILTTVGENATVKISGGKANGTTLSIVVADETPKTLENIKITTAPTKTTYTEGEKFDKTGMKVTATYSDETTEEVTDYIYTPAGELKTTDTAITISYKEGEVTKTATQTITVTAKTPEEQKTLESIKITTAPTKTEYTEGENFDKAGMEVKACYSDKTEAVITNYQITNGENLTKDQTSVTIRYAEGEKTVEVAQKITVKAEDPNTEKTIQFKDENLYAEIKTILGKKIKASNDEELTIKATKKDIEGVTQISPEKKVDDISGIGNFTGLKLLSLQENNLSDISEVEKLTNLTHLSISHTQVEDIKAVSKLTNLKLLNIEASKVTDISGLKDLVNLNELDLRQNNIENIDVVKNFKNLQILRFGENKVRDISAISELSNLEKLWISNNQISDANPIQKLPNLKYYGLENQQVTKYILKTQKEVELPPIFTQAKDKNSKIYTEKEYEFTNCKLNEDGTKVILTTVGETATVKISGGKADGTTLNIIAVDKIPKELTGIEIASYSGKIIYTEGEDFDTSTLKIEAKYSDNSSKELKEGEYEIVDGKNLKVGQNSVTIRYTEGEKTVETTHTIAVKAKEPEVEKTLSKIEITTPPTRTTYTEGEKFDKAGMKVIATYSDGTTKEVTDYTYTPAGELKTTDTAITVSYKEGEKTVEAKYTITVKAKPPVAQKTLESIKVTTAPTRTTYTEGEKFDKTGMKVIATYSDGTTKEVTDYTYTPAGELKTTDTAITVSYKEGEKTVEAKYTITVKAKPPVAQKTLESIKVTTAPTRTTYTEGEKFDKTGMKVIATYSDGTTKEVTDYTYTPAGELKTTDKTITVSYTENELTKTATQEITVVAKGNSGDEPGGETEKAKLDSIEIKEAPTKTVYTEGEKFDKTGMKVIAKYSDGTTKEIKNYAYTPAGALTKKDTTITVSYTENGVTKTDTQKIKIQNKDDGTGAKDKFPDTGAQIPIISGIVLMFAVAVASVVKIKRLTGI